MSVEKPKVKYVDAVRPVLGRSARVFTDKWLVTSRVQRLEDTPNGPIIETLNTVYVPYEPEKDFKYKTYGHRLAA